MVRRFGTQVLAHRATAVGVVVVVGLTLFVGCAGYRAPTNCTNWRYSGLDEPAPGVLPAEFNRNDYKRTSLRDTTGGRDQSIQDQCGQMGAAVDLAWGITKGRPDVRIAVLDSGIRWRDAGSMRDLATQAYINLGEAKPPCYPGVASGDCNTDGRFDIADFGSITDRNGNGVADPEDLILDPAFSNGIDNDRNGYKDDISGWDFLYGDNNPLDTVDYGHGTGEAKDSTAAANGSGDVGVCPECHFIPVRVGDSFIADGGRFAAGVLFGLDSGADVVQEALGVISNPRQAQQAIDAAYNRGVVVVASMADEASEHPNLPASLEHTMPVNSITQRKDELTDAVDGYLALNGCTNFGGNVWVSVPSSSCSSEATGIGAGIMGLVESEARDAGIRPYAGVSTPGGNVLSANEAMQVVRANSDDVDYSTPSGSQPANNYSLPKTAGLITNERYPTRKGWDYINGYGRTNAYEMVRNVKAGLIPPEADLTTPKWYDVLPTTGHLTIKGRVRARFAANFDWRLEWTTGANPPAYPATDTWHTVNSATGATGTVVGTLGTLDLAAVAAALPNGGKGASVGSDGKPDGDRFAVRVRLVATSREGATKGLEGFSQKQVFVHDDPDLVSGYPKRVAGASTSGPVFAQLNGRGGQEMLLATTDGDIHAYQSDGSELPGWPVRTSVAPWWPTGSPTAAAAGITPMHNAVLVGAPAVADISGDGKADVVVADADGNVWAWNAAGTPLNGFASVSIGGVQRSQVRSNPAFATDSAVAQNEFNRTQRAFVGSVAIGNLDLDTKPELVVASLDRHIYAFNHDGTTVDGFPVLLADPAKVSAVDPVTNKVTFAAGSGITESGGLVATPTLFDFDGDGRDEIVEGAQESYVETPDVVTPSSVNPILDLLGDIGNARLYMISPKGRNAGFPDRNTAYADDSAYVPGWPTKLAQLQMNVLPVIGDGVATQAAVADLTTAPGANIIAQTAGGPTYVLNPDGTSAYGTTGGLKNTAAWAGGLLGEGNVHFGANRNSTDTAVAAAAFSGPAVGQLTGDAVPEFATLTAGLTRLMDVGLNDYQPPADDQATAYSPTTGDALPGFPQVTSDLAFFVTPAIADVDGNGKNEVIAGNGVYTLNAFEADGRRPTGWGKLTGGWVLGTPGLGDFDGNGTLEIAVVRRDGVVLVWHTAQPASNAPEWGRFGGNSKNSGVYKG